MAPLAEKKTQEPGKISPRPSGESNVIYVAQSYDGGIDTVQLQGMVRNYYAYHFQFIPGIRRVELKEIADAASSEKTPDLPTDKLQAVRVPIIGAEIVKALAEQGSLPAEKETPQAAPGIPRCALIQLAFEPGTDMARAMNDTVGYVRRSLAFMPPGVPAPFVFRLVRFRVPMLDWSVPIPIAKHVAGRSDGK